MLFFRSFRSVFNYSKLSIRTKTQSSYKDESKLLFNNNDFMDLLRKINQLDANDHRIYPVQNKFLHQLQNTLKAIYNFDSIESPGVLSSDDRYELNVFLTKIFKFNTYLSNFIDANINQSIHIIRNLRDLSRKSKSFSRGILILDVTIYEHLCKFFASKGNILDYQLLIGWMNEDSIIKSSTIYISGLECLGRFYSQNILKKQFCIDSAKSIINDSFISSVKIFDELINYENRWDSLQYVIKILSLAKYSIPRMDSLWISDNYVHKPVFEHIYLQEFSRKNPFSNAFDSAASLKNAFNRQKAIEIQGSLLIQPILPMNESIKQDEFKQQELKKALLKEQDVWREQLTFAFSQNLEQLKLSQRKSRITPYPFLKLLPIKEYVNLIIQIIDEIITDSSLQFTSSTLLISKLGEKFEHACIIWSLKHSNIMKEFEKTYLKYAEQVDSSTIIHESFKKIWLITSQSNFGGLAPLKSICKPWTYRTRYRVGLELYRIMYDNVKFDILARKNVFGVNSKSNKSISRQETPILYEIISEVDNTEKKRIRVHPILESWYKASGYPPLRFSAAELPMLCPPVPRTDNRNADYATQLIRQSYQEMGSKEAYRDSFYSTPSNWLSEIYDALNILSACPWNVNKEVLTNVIEFANNQGDKNLSIIRPIDKPNSLNFKDLKKISKEEQKNAYIEFREKHKEFSNSKSLWASTIYLLSIANANDVIYFPHSMDFRGRVYPCSSLFSYMGNDLSRGILKFAKKVELGAKGFDWLLIHLTNLTGSLKKSSNSERLEFAKNHLDEICDSAEKPFDGKQWWREQEEPWQVLACSKEILAALKYPQGVEKYMTQFPVHQDGSCNGLQHYAALGRDEKGAKSVSLKAMDFPQDVYGDVTLIVEEQRRKDAAGGLEIAKVLDGFIHRKVIKQSVMTTVYGVTLYGAILQIKRQLKDLDDFPKEHISAGSVYLARVTLNSIDKIFTSSRVMQDWFGEISKHIARYLNCRVSWMTPMGLPILQPYVKRTYSRGSKNKFARDSILSLDLPDFHRQTNAFPPNFIHSLDSCHMMLTALHCFRKGITFIAVHDCFWTHAPMVDDLSIICRDEFIALYSQPILEDLSEYMQERFSYTSRELEQIVNPEKKAKALNFNKLLRQVPEKGSFDLNEVRDATYFFS